jgi:hypothetical protein
MEVTLLYIFFSFESFGDFPKLETPTQLCVLSIEPQLLYFLLLNFLSDLDSFSFAMGHQYLPNLIILFQTNFDSPTQCGLFNGVI